jgi:hypothetical protein
MAHAGCTNIYFAAQNTVFMSGYLKSSYYLHNACRFVDWSVTRDVRLRALSYLCNTIRWCLVGGLARVRVIMTIFLLRVVRLLNLG